MDQEHTPTGRKVPGPYNSFLRYSSLGIQLLGAIGICGYAGYRLDLYLELRFPVFLLSFVLLVFAGMMYQIYKQINQE